MLKIVKKFVSSCKKVLNNLCVRAGASSGEGSGSKNSLYPSISVYKSETSGKKKSLHRCFLTAPCLLLYLLDTSLLPSLHDVSSPNLPLLFPHYSPLRGYRSVHHSDFPFLPALSSNAINPTALHSSHPSVLPYILLSPNTSFRFDLLPSFFHEQAILNCFFVFVLLTKPTSPL